MVIHGAGESAQPKKLKLRPGLSERLLGPCYEVSPSIREDGHFREMCPCGSHRVAPVACNRSEAREIPTE